MFASGIFHQMSQISAIIHGLLLPKLLLHVFCIHITKVIFHDAAAFERKIRWEIVIKADKFLSLTIDKSISKIQATL